MLFHNAAELRITSGSEYVWLVTEEAMRAYNRPVGMDYSFVFIIVDIAFDSS